MSGGDDTSGHQASAREPRRRRPGAFRVEGAPEPEAAETPRAESRAPRAFEDTDRWTIEPDTAIEAADAGEELGDRPARRARRGLTFGKLFIGALGFLVSLGIGLAVDQLVRDLFARAEWLGWTALAVACLALIGALGVAVREIVGLMRLEAVDRERQRGRAAYEANDAREAGAVVDGLVALVSDRPETAHGRAALARLDGEVIDGADMIALAEREVLGPLDAKARALVLTAAKRVSVVTAASPKALVDVAYVLYEVVKLIRRMAELYGARPGALGMVRLTRDVLTHLAVTGSIGIGDGLVQQVVGHGVAAKLSARLGEGVVNGLLTARIGLAAMDLCRPLPFLRTQRPSIATILSELSAFSAGRGASAAKLQRPTAE